MKKETATLLIIYTRNIMTKIIKQTSEHKKPKEKALKSAKQISEAILGSVKHPSFFRTTNTIKDFILFCSGKKKLEPEKQLEAAEMILEYRLRFLNSTNSHLCRECKIKNLTDILGAEKEDIKELMDYIRRRKENPKYP